MKTKEIMTLKNLLSGFLLLFLSFGCKTSVKTEDMKITGTIEQQGITTYQYGTHILSNDDTFYALKSDAVDLDQYLNEKVTVTAEKIEGYPVDGGPDFLLVLKVD